MQSDKRAALNGRRGGLQRCKAKNDRVVCKTQRSDLHGPGSCNDGSVTALMVLYPQRQHARTTALQQLTRCHMLSARRLATTA